MLRPATPLSILLFISFVLLLISVLSAPIIKGVPLATANNVNLGVFGYCQQNGQCSGIRVGYKTDDLFGDAADFNLPSSARNSLSSLLIVHPVAALCNLIVLCLALAAHFHSPSHSARYLLGLLILLLPTLLVTLLAFLVDILLFVPHVSWGGWIVLASTILITASGVVTCAMRRTLVSRKARKKRIAENAEMSGENFYNRQEQESKMMAVPTISSESKAPLVDGSPGANDLPAFPAYDGSRGSMDRQRQQQHQPQPNGNITPVSPVNDEARYYANSSRSNSRPPPGETGIPLAPMRSQSSDGPFRPPVDSRTPAPHPPNAYGLRGGYGPPRGRGGPPPRGGFAPRGGLGSRGPPPQGYGRGGFGPEMRGNYGGRGRGDFPGAPMAAGAIGGAMVAGSGPGRGPPPPGYPPQNRDVSPERYGSRQDFAPSSQTNPSTYSRGETTAYDPASPSQYTVADANATNYIPYNQQSSVKAASLHSRGQSPAGMRRSPSPPPTMPIIGQAVAMDASHGRPTAYDSDIPNSPHSHHSQDRVGISRRELPQEYVPPRTQWKHGDADVDAIVHHAATMSNPSFNRPRGTSNASGSYYEDVDPRFAENTDVVSALPQRNINVHQPQSLPPNSYNNQNLGPDSGNPLLPHSASYEELPVGARSPAESETSHFTSVSQRGVNPNWRPGHGGEFNNFAPRRPQQARQDVILANNPDFELVPPPARFAPRGGRGGFRGGPMGGAGGGRMLPPSALSMGGDSPYPGPATMREI